MKTPYWKPLLLAGLALTATYSAAQTAGTAGRTQQAPSADMRSEQAAAQHVADAVVVALTMQGEPRLKELLAKSRGVYIVPHYRRAAVGVGAAGGAGVLLVRRADGSWTDPAFYNSGAVSIGLQAGVQGGALAMILMNDKALDSFRNEKNNFNLSADAGLTVVNWARMAQGTAGTGDVVAWSGAKGLFGNAATIALQDIRFNQKQTNAYYKRTLAVQDIIDGKVSNEQAAPLRQALATREPSGSQ